MDLFKILLIIAFTSGCFSFSWIPFVIMAIIVTGDNIIKAIEDNKKI